MMFGEYFPNPGVYGPRADSASLVAPWAAALFEGVGTALLGFVIFALVDKNNTALPSKHLAPVFIGGTVAIIISVSAPITQAGLNPARDFGQRIIAYIAGWKKIAIPGPDNGFWVYIIGPLVGAPFRAFLYDLLIRRGQHQEIPAGSEVSNGPVS